MTPADPRDGLPGLPEPALIEQREHLSKEYDHYYTADQMRAYAEQRIAHARPKAADDVALTKLCPNEKRCETCGRAVWNGVEPRIGWLAPCGKLVARIEDCGKFPTCVEPLTPDQSP